MRVVYADNFLVNNFESELTLDKAGIIALAK